MHDRVVWPRCGLTDCCLHLGYARQSEELVIAFGGCEAVSQDGDCSCSKVHFLHRGHLFYLRCGLSLEALPFLESKVTAGLR